MEDLNLLSDETLVSLFAKGENSAFDELLQRHQNRIFSYILNIVKDKELADDLFQETFVKAIMTIRQGRYQSSGKFYAWLTRIAHNLLIDQFREERNLTLVYNDEKENGWQTLQGYVEPTRESQLANEQVLADVRRLMEHLPAEQREMVYMRYYKGLSFKEIVDLTGLGINTALGRMRYAILNMRKMAKQYHINLY